MAGTRSSPMALAIAALIVVVAVSVVQSAKEATAPSSSASFGGSVVWQGFDHEWLREAGSTLETPHRMGRFSSTLENTTATGGAGGAAAAVVVTSSSNITFAPGYSPDWATPSVYYTAVVDQNDPPVVGLGEGAVVWQFADMAAPLDDWNPTANTSLKYHLAVDLNTENLGWGSFDSYDVVMRGININIRCDPDTQPPGYSCHSDAMWPFHLFMGFENCQRTQSSLFECDAILEIGRAWTPDHGLGKDFDYSLTFVVTLFYTCIGGNAEHFKSVDVPLVNFSSTILKGVESGNGSVSSLGFPQAVMALRNFGFTLLHTKYDVLGRYMGRLAFTTKTSNVDTLSQTLEYQWSAGFFGPLTTLQSAVEYVMQLVALQFSTSVWISEPSSSQGSVCVSGLGVSCSRMNLPEQESEIVKITVSQT